MGDIPTLPNIWTHSKSYKLNNKIEIPLSKKKIILLLLAAIAFVAGGIWIATNPERFIPNIFRITNPEIIRIAGVVEILFFGAAGIYGIKKLFDKKVGLIIDSNGITDNSNATSIGLVKWEDITGIRVLEVVNQKFVMIDISNPEHYIGLKKSGIGKMTMKANYNKYGSPISITANSLKADFKEVWEIIKKQYEKNALQQRV